MHNNIGRGAEAGSPGRNNRRLYRWYASLPKSHSQCLVAEQRADERIARWISPALGLIALGVLAIQPHTVLAAEPAAGASLTVASSSADPAPTIEEWLNQLVRLRDTTQALDRPAVDGKSAGEIRAGAEIKAIGFVAGKSWVQIELPNNAIAYLPRSAIEFENGGGAASQGTIAAGQTPPVAPPPILGGATSAAATSAAATPAGTQAAVGGAIRGTVSKVPNAATLVVADQRIRLSGIDPGPTPVLAPFEKWVEAQGSIDCEPDAQTGRYRCLTANGIDVAQAAILNGSGRVGDGAMPTYRDSETQARNAKRGLWLQP
jgi:endonuclease YncB( thermonuclease family)